MTKQIGPLYHEPAIIMVVFRRVRLGRLSAGPERLFGSTRRGDTNLSLGGHSFQLSAERVEDGEVEEVGPHVQRRPQQCKPHDAKFVGTANVSKLLHWALADNGPCKAAQHIAAGKGGPFRRQATPPSDLPQQRHGRAAGARRGDAGNKLWWAARASSRRP